MRWHELHRPPGRCSRRTWPQSTPVNTSQYQRTEVCSHPDIGRTPDRTCCRPGESSSCSAHRTQPSFDAQTPCCSPRRSCCQDAQLGGKHAKGHAGWHAATRHGSCGGNRPSRTGGHNAGLRGTAPCACMLCVVAPQQGVGGGGGHLATFVGGDLAGRRGAVERIWEAAQRVAPRGHAPHAHRVVGAGGHPGPATGCLQQARDGTVVGASAGGDAAEYPVATWGSRTAGVAPVTPDAPVRGRRRVGDVRVGSGLGKRTGSGKNYAGAD